MQHFADGQIDRQVSSLANRWPEITLRARMIDLSTLNPEQRRAVQTIDGPVLILAGAGTGKTRVITCRIAYMIGRGVSAGNILAVTFTNKAAREMKERIGTMVSKESRRDPETGKDGLTISTFHSLCVRILRKYIDRLGYKSNFVIYDDSEQIGVIKKILSNLSTKGGKIDPRAVLSMQSRLKNAGAEKAFQLDPDMAALAQRIQTRYDSALHACNAVDFDDLILLTLKLFREHPDALEGCRSKYRYVMVDEYQDTNAAQFELVHLLTKEHRNLCVVGDDDQSIYGWRGAEVANLLDLEKHYPEVKVVKLEQNYRSTNIILQAANAVIKNNAQRRAKSLWSQKGQGEKILIYSYPNEEEEAKSLAEQIEFDRVARKIPWSEQAILFRTNMQSRPLETALRQAGVRYNLIGGQSFFDRREIRDVMAYLKTFVNPNDDNNMLRIANVPARGLSDVTMERLLMTSQERHCSVYASMRHTDVLESFQSRTRESIMAFVGLIEQSRAAIQENKMPISQWTQEFLKEIDYLNDLRRTEKNVENGENRVRNLLDFVGTIDKDAAGTEPALERIDTFLEEITLDNDRKEEKETLTDAVTLITTHSCKGLEFPQVHVVGLEEGLLPHTRSKVEGTLDEERRLFYVAITRAMRMLTMSFCESRKKHGQLMPCHPSSFLKELPLDLVEWSDEKASKPVQATTGKSYFAAMREALG
jgi:superfamily I DNA/RNA helicase